MIYISKTSDQTRPRGHTGYLALPPLLPCYSIDHLGWKLLNQSFLVYVLFSFYPSLFRFPHGVYNSCAFSCASRLRSRLRSRPRFHSHSRSHLRYCSRFRPRSHPAFILWSPSPSPFPSPFPSALRPPFPSVCVSSFSSTLVLVPAPSPSPSTSTSLFPPPTLIPPSIPFASSCPSGLFTPSVRCGSVPMFVFPQSNYHASKQPYPVIHAAAANPARGQLSKKNDHFAVLFPVSEFDLARQVRPYRPMSAYPFSDPRLNMVSGCSSWSNKETKKSNHQSNYPLLVPSTSIPISHSPLTYERF